MSRQERYRRQRERREEREPTTMLTSPFTRATRHDAPTASPPSPTPAPAALPVSPAFTAATVPTRPTRAPLRDVVTGVALDRETLAHAGGVMIVADQTERLDLHPLGYELGRTARPLTLHRHVQDGEVGLQYSRPFAHYLASVKPLSVLNEEAKWWRWWEDEYVVARLKHHLDPECFAIAMARIAGRVPLEVVERGRFHYQETVAGVPVSFTFQRRSRRYVMQCERDAVRLVRALYYPREWLRRERETVTHTANGVSAQ